MDALKLLTNRRSSKKLKHPAPDAAELEQILQAATQVSDHGNMRPFRFTVIQGEVASSARCLSLSSQPKASRNNGLLTHIPVIQTLSNP